MPNQMQVPAYPSIPAPDLTVGGLVNSVTALKRCVELLTAQDTSGKEGDRHNRFAPHVFVQVDTPTALHEGDLWLSQGTSSTFNIWNGTAWLKIATLPA